MAYSDRRSKIAGCLLVPVILAAAFWLLLTLAFPGPYTSAFPRTFDSAVWKQNAEVDTNVRCAMIADLRFRIGLKGRSRDDLARLLGPPENRTNQPETSFWLLCPSFMDIWVLEVRWEGNRVADDWVRDT